MAILCLLVAALCTAGLMGWLLGEWLVDSSSEDVDQSFLHEMELLLSLDQEKEDAKRALIADSISVLKSWASRKEVLHLNALTRAEMLRDLRVEKARNALFGIRRLVQKGSLVPPPSPFKVMGHGEFEVVRVLPGTKDGLPLLVMPSL